MKNRKEYEAKAEIIVKKLKAKMYEIEAKTLEAKLKAQEGLGEFEDKIKALKIQREKLDQKFDDIKNASQEKWNSLVTEFEKFVELVKADKHDFYEKADLWINDLAGRIEELEEKAKHANIEVKKKINEQIENLKQQKESLSAKLKELKESRGETWHNLKLNFDEGVTNLKESINHIFNSFKD